MDTSPTLLIGDPGDLLETIPYLLGFRPEQSLVMIGFRDAQVVLTTRIDLIDASSNATVEHTVSMLRRAGARDAVLVIYGADDDEFSPDYGREVDVPNHAIIDQATQFLAKAGIDVGEALYVGGDHWWSYVGRAEGCPSCVHGEPMPGDESVAAASAVFAGLTALPNRAAFAAVLDPPPEHERQRLLPRIEAVENTLHDRAIRGDLARELRSMKRAIFAAARDGDRALFSQHQLRESDARLARFSVGLSEVTIRDALWLAIDQNRIDGRNLWHLLSQRLPSPYDSAPLFLFGWACWRTGNGSLAMIAADRALESNPGYSAAQLLLSAVQQGLDPYRTPKLRMPRR